MARGGAHVPRRRTRAAGGARHRAHPSRLQAVERAHRRLIGEKSGATKANLAITVYNRGELEADAKDWEASLADDRRALALFEATPTSRPSYLIFPLLGQGHALVELGRPREAVAPLSRAITIEAGGEAAKPRAEARLWLGRALVESGEGGRGRALMRAAREELVKLGPDAAESVRAADGMIARLH